MEISKRPKDDAHFPQNIFERDKGDGLPVFAPFAAVVTPAAIVADGKDGVFRNGKEEMPTHIAPDTSGGGDAGLVLIGRVQKVIAHFLFLTPRRRYKNIAVEDFDGVAGETDDALDKKFADTARVGGFFAFDDGKGFIPEAQKPRLSRVLFDGRIKNNNVAAFWRREPI